MFVVITQDCSTSLKFWNLKAPLHMYIALHASTLRHKIYIVRVTHREIVKVEGKQDIFVSMVVVPACFPIPPPPPPSFSTVLPLFPHSLSPSHFSSALVSPSHLPLPLQFCPCFPIPPPLSDLPLFLHPTSPSPLQSCTRSLLLQSCPCSPIPHPPSHLSLTLQSWNSLSPLYFSSSLPADKQTMPMW